MASPGEGRWGRAALLAALAGAVGVLWWARLRYWYPHDEGTLAQAALRVAQGEVPHRDFVHPYTGADALIHALLFRVASPSLEVIRNGFALLTTMWLVATAAWFRRHLGSAGAAIAVLLLGSWGVATYPAAVPSWYVTILVTAALMLLVPRPGAIPSARGILASGVVLGLAFSFKVTSLYAVVGVVAWLLSRDQHEDRPARPWVPALMLVAVLAAVRLLGADLTARTAAHLLIPPLAVAAWVVARELRQWARAGARLGLATMRDPALLGLGLLLGAAPVLVWLTVNGALRSFLAGVSGVGALRAEYAGMPAPPLESLYLALPMLGLLALGWLRHPPRAWLVLLPCTLVFVLAWSEFEWHRIVWLGVRGAVPLGLLLALARVWRRPTGSAEPWVAPALVLGWMVLSQYPFAAAIYFVYLVPLIVMTGVAARGLEIRGRRVLATIGLAFAAFGYLQVVPSPPTVLGWNREPLERLARLPGPRGGLLVPANDSIVFARLLGILGDSVPSGPIWAGPDSPEVAFLAGRRDLNPASFGFLADRGPGAQIDEAVALVVRQAPPFSAPPTPQAIAAWQQRFSRRADLGAYTVFWGGPVCDEC